MQTILHDYSDYEFKNHLCVNVTDALDQFDREQEEYNEQTQGKGDSNKKVKQPKLNLQIIKYQPNSKKKCEETTSLLYRLFKNHFFPQSQFGDLTMFVCEFIESSNGITYFIGVKAFQCDFNVPQVTVGCNDKKSHMPTSRCNSVIKR